MDLEARHEAIFSEFRDLKRRAVSEEELARQEERVLIADEIHDSVGHKLTALIMQLEMFRLQTSENERERVESLKELANESLDETRRAVKSLKANDTGGLPGILRLIRRLELENMMHIHFAVKYGAFSAPLTGEQSFVIYRSVQEALTNIMKHSDAKEAEITFEAPGGSIFRFEIRNPSTGTDSYLEGFGLSQMRQRFEKHNGGMKVYQTEGHFIVISGVYVPPGVMDNPVFTFIADLFPMGYAIEAMMDAALFGAGWNDILLPVSFMLLIAVIYMGIGINLGERSRR